MRARRNTRGLAHLLEFATALEESHLMQHVLERDHLVRRMTAVFRLGAQAIHPTDDTLVELAIDTHGIENLRSTLHQPGQDLVDIADRKSIVGAIVPPRARGSRTSPIPGFALRITLAQEQQIFALRPTRHQHRHRLGLGKAREVMKVAVLSVGMLDVVVAPLHGRCGNDRDRVATHRLHQLPTAPRKFVSTDGRWRR